MKVTVRFAAQVRKARELESGQLALSKLTNLDNKYHEDNELNRSWSLSWAPATLPQSDKGRSVIGGSYQQNRCLEFKFYDPAKL